MQILALLVFIEIDLISWTFEYVDLAKFFSLLLNFC